MSPQKNGALVYSTELGRLCPHCQQPVKQCVCRTESLPQGDGIVRISLDTKGRKGKGVTLLKGILLPNDGLKKLATELKQKCGVGGAVKDGVIEIQGDHRERLMELLTQQGYKVKQAGG